MPRKAPLTQKDIKERMRRFDSDSWDFEAAFECLGISNVELRERCGEWLNLICRLYWATKLGEQQETPARKAEAFKMARRRWPRWRRLTEQLEKAPKLHSKEKQTAASGSRALEQLWLPKFLEQEAARLPFYDPADPRGAFADLEACYRRRSRSGRHQSRALEDTVRRIQGAASEIDERLNWRRGETCPPRLIPFIDEVLNAARIPHPDPADNASRFRRLMFRAPPPEPSQQGE
jgi:hypothetical protein